MNSALGTSLVVAICGGVALFASCSTTQSTLDVAAGREATMFPVTTDQAHSILVTSITRQFPGLAASPVEVPYPGFRITLHFALDSHEIVAYMVKVKGRDRSGKVVDGFAFEVDASGTMAIQGTVRADELFKRIQQEAAKLAPPLPIVSRP